MFSYIKCPADTAIEKLRQGNKSIENFKYIRLNWLCGVLLKTRKSLMIVLIGISGAGKSTLIDYVYLTKNLTFKKLVAVTDREPRSREVDGIDKYFLTTSKFAQENDENLLCLVNLIYNNNYGFYKKDFLDGSNYLCELYYKNYSDFKAYHRNSVSLYVRPVKLSYAMSGIRERGSAQEEIYIRGKNIFEEHTRLEKLSNDNFFDYVYTNKYDSNSKNEFVALTNEITNENRS